MDSRASTQDSSDRVYREGYRMGYREGYAAGMLAERFSDSGEHKDFLENQLPRAWH